MDELLRTGLTELDGQQGVGNDGEVADAWQYSISEIVDENGKSYGIGVYLDSVLLENLTEEERVQMVKERVKELGGQHFTAFDNNGNEVDIQIAEPQDRFVNKSGKSIPVNKDLTTKNRNSRIKQESVVLADELITTARHSKDSAARYSHGWLDNNGKNDWAQWKTYVQDKENTIWEATLHVATTANGEKILYDIDPIRKVGQSGNSDTPTVTRRIFNSSENVNSKFSVSEDGKTQDELLDFVTQFRSACAVNGTTPTTEIKRFIAEYCEQGGGFALRRPCKTKQPVRGRRDGRRSSRSEGARRG